MMMGEKWVIQISGFVSDTSNVMLEKVTLALLNDEDTVTTPLP